MIAGLESRGTKLGVGRSEDAKNGVIKDLDSEFLA